MVRAIALAMDIARPDLKLKKNRKRLVIAGIAAVVVAIGIMGLSRLEPAAPSVDRASVWLDQVKRGEMLREVCGPGTLVPQEIRWIAAETNARVERIVVKPGAEVQPDTVVLELSNPEVDDQLLAARAALAAAQADYTAKRVDLESQVLDQRANLAAVEADYEGTRLQAEAERDLNKKGIIADINYKRTQLTAERQKIRLDIEKERVQKLKQNLDAQLAADRARIETTQNTLALRERQADALKVKAGIAGVLQQVPVEVG